MSKSASIPGDISPKLEEGTLLFREYGDNFMRLNEDQYHASILVHQNKVQLWNVVSMDLIKNADFGLICEDLPEILLIGTGGTTGFPSSEVMCMLTEMDMGFEFMSTQACMRTYNILVMEGRNVSAAVLLPGHGYKGAIIGL